MGVEILTQTRCRPEGLILGKVLIDVGGYLW